jgi:DNA (cytosine-5)-methyltransferase 1
MWPLHEQYRHLSDLVNLSGAQPLSAKATAGFLSRAHRSSLRFVPGFLADLEEHLQAVTGTVSVVA